MGVTRDSRMGHFWIKQAARRDHPNALSKMGQFYKLGFIEPKNIERAIEYYRRAADLGNRQAFYELALFALRGEGMKQDFQVARQYFERAANEGHRGAMIELGTVHLMEDNPDKSEAKRWLCKSGKQGQEVYREMQNEDLECDGKL